VQKNCYKNNKMNFRKILLYLCLIVFLSPLLVFAGEVYKWVDEKGTLNLTDDPKLIPEKYRNQTEKILVPDKYEEPRQVIEKVVVPPSPEPEKPRIVTEEPPSGFIPFEKFKYISEGMTEAEVLSRLGPPTREVADEMVVKGYFSKGLIEQRQFLVKRYYYIGDPDLGERTTVIHFSNGIVQKIERIYPPTW
jgi:hypothetical protein